jgi:hypothetical protein
VFSINISHPSSGIPTSDWKLSISPDLRGPHKHFSLFFWHPNKWLRINYCISLDLSGPHKHFSYPSSGTPTSDWELTLSLDLFGPHKHLSNPSSWTPTSNWELTKYLDLSGPHKHFSYPSSGIPTSDWELNISLVLSVLHKHFSPFFWHPNKWLRIIYISRSQWSP